MGRNEHKWNVLLYLVTKWYCWIYCNICALEHMFVYGYATAMFRGKKSESQTAACSSNWADLATVWCEPFSDVAKGWIMVPVQMLSIQYEWFSWMIIYCWWSIHINLSWLWLIYELLIYVNDPKGCKYSVCIRDVVGKRQGIWLCNVACCEFCEFVKRSVITFTVHMYPPEV